MFAGLALYSSSTVVDYPGEQQLREFGASTCRFYFDSGAGRRARTRAGWRWSPWSRRETSFQRNSSTVSG